MRSAERYRYPVAPVEHSAAFSKWRSIAGPAGCLETFMYARAMGWPHVAVYDGGWYEWSSNPHNPVARGERGPESSQ